MIGVQTPAHHIAFGPVPSRRLGRSLGVNNVTTKACTYACVYCQVGPTTEQTIEPREFFTPEAIYQAVDSQLRRVRDSGSQVDYLTFVPDGEPTLDSRLGESIEALQGLGIPVAVISNGSLLWRADVRARLRRADLVSVKVDSVDPHVWHRVNRPHAGLELERVLAGIKAFAADYTGTLITDSMLIAGVNDDPASLTASADFLAAVAPDTACLAVPTRPTTEPGVQGSDEAGLVRAHALFSARLAKVELLTGRETGEFAHTGNARNDLLAVTAVHPMSERQVRRLLSSDGADWSLVDALLAAGELMAVEHAGEVFYLRPVRCHRHDFV